MSNFKFIELSDGNFVAVAALVDADGNNLASNKSLNISIQDQASEIIDLHFSKEIAALTLTANTNIDDKTITADCGILPVLGNSVCLKEGSAFYQGEIISIVDNGGGNYTLGLDSPLDFAFTTAGGCSLRDVNMNKNGSVTPQIFSISPKNLQAGLKWHITRVLFQILDDTAMDDSLFGGIAALANGIVVRKKDGTYKNIFNIKSNSDFALHAYDITYSSKAPAGQYGLRVRRSFNGADKNGVVVELSADNNDELQIIIQDNLTGLIKFEAVAQGHIVED